MTMKMRDLEARTGVNRETIRVYLRHGLVPEPVRSKRNVADYDESHVRAILAVRQLQRDSGLTLRQIRDVLNGESGERRIEAGAFQSLEELVSTSMGQSGQPVLLSALAKASPEAEADARALEQIGVVRIVDSEAGPALSVTDTRLVHIWGEMRAAGFTEELGFSTETLNFYTEPVRFIATKEAEVFLKHMSSRVSEEKAAEMVAVALRLLLDFMGLIRMKTFLQYVQAAKEPQHPAAAAEPAPAG